MSQTSHGTHALTPTQHAVCRLLAAGYSKVDVSKKLGVPRSTLYTWLNDLPEMGEFIGSLVSKADENTAELLEYGEGRAVAVLLDLMENSIDDRVRMSAAIEFLNRRGQRGKPVDRQQISSTVLEGNVTEALRAALADPGVQAWLQDQPELRAELTAGSTMPESTADEAAQPPNRESHPDGDEDYEFVSE